MALPRRFSWPLAEVAARWSCYQADIIDWSLRGDLEICTALAIVTTARGEISGLVVVPAEDLVRMFRRDGSGPRLTTIRRVRKPGADEEWMKITEPSVGVHLETADLIILQDELERFEDAHEIGPRPRFIPGGAHAKWDWDGFYTALIRRIHHDGVPDSQRDLVEEMQGWFERRSEKGETPDISTIRKKISSVWRELRPD